MTHCDRSSFPVRSSDNDEVDRFVTLLRPAPSRTAEELNRRDRLRRSIPLMAAQPGGIVVSESIERESGAAVDSAR